MNRRSFLAAAVVAPLLAAVAACGDDSKKATEPTPLPNDGGTVESLAPTVGIAHPTGAQDAVLKLSYEGGFVPAGTTFVNTPALLVSGDGHVYTPAVTSAIFPGPLLPSILVKTITESGIQRILGIVQKAGLFVTKLDLSGGTGVADASSTVLTINANGKNYVQNAYALGADNPESPARQAMLGAVNIITDVAAAAGEASLGEDQPFVADKYRFQARVVDQTELDSQQPAPTIVDWPALTTLPLASAATCAVVNAAAVGSLLVDAKQNTYFKDGDVVYQLAVAGVLPGDPDC
jgi:hypothetical protein